jgi:hypothetical protein
VQRRPAVAGTTGPRRAARAGRVDTDTPSPRTTSSCSGAGCRRRVDALRRRRSTATTTAHRQHRQGFAHDTTVAARRAQSRWHPRGLSDQRHADAAHRRRHHPRSTPWAGQVDAAASTTCDSGIRAGARPSITFEPAGDEPYHQRHDRFSARRRRRPPTGGSPQPSATGSTPVSGHQGSACLPNTTWPSSSM